MTKSKLRKLLTKPKFRAWLEAKKPDAIVGFPRCSYNCPIGRYIRGGRLENIRVDRHAVNIPFGQRFILREWCTRFIGAVDGLAGGAVVTASRALRILDGIK